MVRIAMVLSLFVCLTASGQVRYVPNHGQWPDHIHHRAESRGGGVQVESTGWTCWQWYPGDTVRMANGHPRGAREGIAWKAEFVGGQIDLNPTWDRNELSDDVQHHYLSNDPGHWAEYIRAAARVETAGPWAGTRLRWRGTNRGHAKFEFTVEPGADPTPIAWTYTGVSPELAPDGRLILRHPLHNDPSGFSAHLERPLAYQLLEDGTFISIPCGYAVDGQSVRFSIGEYDAALPLVLDPEIVFASYVGSLSDNWGTTACNGPGGSLVAGSIVFAPGYPVTPNAIQTDYDQLIQGDTHVGLTVFNAEGDALLYSTYIGGDHYDIPHSLAFDPASQTIAMLGSTGSLDFPVTANAHQPSHSPGTPESAPWAIPFSPNAGPGGTEQQPEGVDYFITALDAANFTLSGSTYFGGSQSDGWNTSVALNRNYGDQFRGQIDFGPNGSIWMAGCSKSTDLNLPGSPPHAGGQDALIAGFTSDLTNLIAGRFFGGSEDDAAFGICVEADGSAGSLNNLEVLVGGGTASFNLPLPPGSYQPGFSSPAGEADGWVGLFTVNTGSLESTFATYHAKDTYDQVYFVDRGTDGSIYAYGQAAGGMPVIGTVYENPNAGQFLTRFFDDLSDIEWQTNVGSGMNAVDISPTAFLVSDCDQIFISGWGGSTNSGYAGGDTQDLPTTSDAFQSSSHGSDFYLAVLAPDATDLVYATFIGGQQTNEHNDGGSCRFDENGTVYHSACASCSSWDDFPTTPGAWSETDPSPNGTTPPTNAYNAANPFGNSCNMGVFKFALGSMNAAMEISGPDVFCIGESVQFVNNTGGQADFTWLFGDASNSNLENPDHLYGIPGTYEVMLIAEDPIGCLDPDTAFITLTVEPDADPQIDPIDPLCLGDAMTLSGAGNGTLSWSPATNLSASNIPNPIASPTGTTTYTLTDQTNCSTESVDILVEVIDMATSSSSDTQICLGDAATLAITSPVPGASSWDYNWSPIDGLSDASVPDPSASPNQTTTYSITVTSPEGCIREHEITVDVVPSAPGGNTYPTINLCDGLTTQLNAADGNSWIWSPTNGLNNPASQNPWANPLESTTYSVTITNLCGTGADEVTVNVIVPQAIVSPDGWICAGEPFEVSAAGGVSYQWVPGMLVTQPNAPATTVITETSQTFTAYVTDSNGCVASADVNVNVWPRPNVEAGPDQRNEWLEPTYLYGSISGAPIDSLWWSPSEPLSCSDCLIPEVVFQEDGIFTLHVIDTNGCRSADRVEVEFLYPLYAPSGFTPNGDGVNDGWRPEGNWLNGAGTYILGAPDGSLLPGYRVEIWDRWGALIWVSEDPRAYWTGGVGGPGTSPSASTMGKGQHSVPPGIYTWRVFFPTEKGLEERSGRVTVIR